MNWQDIHKVYFIGIGGIGMSALARYFHQSGKSVAGYDRTPSELTDELSSEGIAIHFEDDVQQIAAAFKDTAHTLIVYTPAVPKDHNELNYFLSNGFTVEKRAKVLGRITANTFSIAVAGTHGKTTTSTMVAHLLKDSGMKISAFLGGISANYHTNYLNAEGATCTVAEADEFDRSFLQLNPDMAIITSTDADHLDIYGTDEAIKNTYNEFAAKLKPGGTLFYHISTGLSGGIPYAEHANGAALYTEHLEVADGRFEFDVTKQDQHLGRFSLAMPGRHNVENILAAIGIAHELKIDTEKIRKAVASFRGVKRRFEMIIADGPIRYIDDYAHHPTEIAAFIKGLRDLYPGKKLTGIFQPHLYSRTRDFAEGFSESLSALDEVILLDIYPARELPITDVSSDMLLENIRSPYKISLEKNALMDFLEKHISSCEVIATIGAGDIDRFVKPIKQLIESQTA